MLARIKTLGPWVGLFSLLNFWSIVAPGVLKIIDDFHDHPIAKGFYPHFNEVALRQEVLSRNPELSELQEQISWLMESEYSAVFLESLHLKSFSDSDRNTLLYGLSLAIGYPTPTDTRKGKLLWDVKPRTLPAGQFVTYSEHSS